MPSGRAIYKNGISVPKIPLILSIKKSIYLKYSKIPILNKTPIIISILAYLFP
jgi:hypothetical protein